MMIHITRRGWDHIQKNHTARQIGPSANKSIFNPGEDLIKLIHEAARHTPIIQKAGHMARVFDAGHVVGIERHSRSPTRMVTVITNTQDELLTMFPGHL